MARVFPAKYRGRCTECPELIELGDEIVMGEDGPAHADCALVSEVARTDVSVRKAAAICRACNLQHAGECF